MRIHHIALRTEDVARLELFYTNLFELPIRRRTESGSVWLDADGTVIMIEMCTAAEPSPNPASLDFLAFAVSANDKARIREKVERQSVHIESETAHTLYFRDPDGRRVGVSDYLFSR